VALSRTVGCGVKNVWSVERLAHSGVLCVQNEKEQREKQERLVALKSTPP
jgi:hypothetical protein